ncbi:MAG: hypothetical protein ACK5IC_11585 [Moheibacter sp.]
MKRNYLILIIVSIFFISCNKNKNIGGYNVNYNINKKGEYIDVNEKEFYDYQKEFSEESNFKNEKLYNKEIILIIEHENKDVDLYDKTVTVFEGGNYISLYHSKYQEEIEINIGYDKPYYSNFNIYISDKRNKTIHKFSSELTYPIFDKNVKLLKIKLIENQRFAIKNEILYCYKIINLKSELEEMGYKIK